MSIEKTLEERGQRYGEFKHHAEIAQKLQDVMRESDGWGRLAFDQKQALTVIADKIARMLNGAADYRDNWHDIVGYAKLVDDRMAKDEAEEAQPKCVSDGKECFYVNWNSPDIPKGANCVIAALKGEGEKFYAESFSAGSKYWDLNGKEYGRMIMTSDTGWILVCERPMVSATDPDEFTCHDGRDVPNISAGKLIDIKYRDGSILSHAIFSSAQYMWRWDKTGNDAVSDIIGWRLSRD